MAEDKRDHCKCGSFVDDNGQHEGMTDKCTGGASDSVKAQYDYDIPSMVDQRIVDFAKRVKSKQVEGNEMLIVSPVQKRERADIENLIGRSINAEKHVINASEIKHTLNRHGENGQADHTMADIEDFGLIGYVVSNYEDIKLLPEERSSYCSATGESAEVIAYYKEIKGKVQVVVEAISDGKKGNLHIVSAYKIKK